MISRLILTIFLAFITFFEEAFIEQNNQNNQIPKHRLADFLGECITMTPHESLPFIHLFFDGREEEEKTLHFMRIY